MLIDSGYLRVRKDGILEYIIGKEQAIRELLEALIPFQIIKKERADLMLEILKRKSEVKNRDDFRMLTKPIERFRELNYSKKRKRRVLTP